MSNRHQNPVLTFDCSVNCAFLINSFFANRTTLSPYILIVNDFYGWSIFLYLLCDVTFFILTTSDRHVPDRHRRILKVFSMARELKTTLSSIQNTWAWIISRVIVLPTMHRQFFGKYRRLFSVSSNSLNLTSPSS